MNKTLEGITRWRAYGTGLDVVILRLVGPQDGRPLNDLLRGFGTTISGETFRPAFIPDTRILQGPWAETSR
jgi:hypothetical protein